MIVRQWCLPVMLLLGAAACSKNTATPATNERTAMDAAAAKAVNDTDAALRDAAAPLPEAALPRRQGPSATPPLVEPR